MVDKESPTSTISSEPSGKKRRSTAGQPLLVVTVYSWNLPIVILVVFLAGLLLGYSLRPRENPPQAARPTLSNNPTPAGSSEQSRQQVMALIAAQTKNYIGNEQAPVRMYEFSDFRCPYCAKYNLETGKKIFSNYIDTGKVYLGFIHLAILGEESIRAAVASECAAEQQKFWEYHESLFAQRQKSNAPDYSSESLKALAQQLGLDLRTFSECLDTGRHTSTVLQQTQFARQIGLTSTPSFIINGKAIIGAQPYEVFESVIEAALKESTQ